MKHQHEMEAGVSTNDDLVCVLSAVETRRWEYHQQPPAGCERRKHSHITGVEARTMVREGHGLLALIAGRWRVVPINLKKWVNRTSGGGPVVRQLVSY